MHVLIRLVLQFQVHNGQAVQEENEINLLGRLAGRGCPKVKMRAEGDAVLSVARRPGARGGPRLGVVEQQPHALLHFEAIPQNHPERFALQFLAQRLEHLVPRVRAVIFLQLFERVGLGGFEEGPEEILGDEMNMPSMFQHWSFCGPPAVANSTARGGTNCPPPWRALPKSGSRLRIFFQYSEGSAESVRATMISVMTNHHSALCRVRRISRF